MVTGERLRITVTGGTPWGFRLQGGGHFPLEVAKIRKKSHSFAADLREGDIVLSINGYQMSGKTHQSAMEIVEMSSSELVFEVVRPHSGGSTKVLDPQRQLRSIPASSKATSDHGLVSSARKNFTTQEGNTRREVHTDEYVMKSPSGKQITKTVREERTITVPNSIGLSPHSSQNIIPPGGHKSRSPNRSPLIWQPPSISPSQSQSSSLKVETQRSTQSSSQPALLSPRTPSDTQSRSPLMWQPKSTSPSPAARQGSQGRSPSSLSSRSYGKENEDPLMASEQAKWEARKGPENVPKFKLENFGGARAAAKSKYATLPRVNDPSYPMFDVPRPDWSPQRHVPPAPPQPDLQQSFPPPQLGKKPEPPPVPPKPVSPVPPTMHFDPIEQPVAGSERHHPGMIRPPAQPNVVTAPAPPPPPMPPSMMPPMMTPSRPPGIRLSASHPHLFQPDHASSPKEYGYDEVDIQRSRPDHLPVFAPKVYFTPEDDSGLHSPDRSGFPDQYSDVSSLTKKKLFSDSAFYDDHTNRYPTIDEQMSMCKKIADSLTSAANKRAKGARMFMKRRRKANKWIHDQRADLFLIPGTSEYSSSAGDVADLEDLDSELYWDEGGSRPLFTFRIPKIAGQVSQGQRMSLTKEEFERLRLVAPRVDHQAVSPQQCFSIAADLHKGGRNKGAKLFQKRQARVERFVIDESNVQHSPVSPTRLEQIVQNQPVPRPQHSPWDAAAQGNMNAAFNQKTPQRNFQQVMVPTPKHSLLPENQPKVLGGRNYNTLARGWQGSGAGHQQHSYYREGIDLDPDVTPESEQQQQETLGEGHEKQPSPASFPGDYQQWQDGHREDSQDGGNTFGDYNPRIKAWPGSGTPTKRTVQSYSEQTNYNSLPRGFGMQPKHDMSVSAGYCDL